MCSSFLLHHRVARRVIVDNEKVKTSNVVGTILVSTRLNIIGLGATLIGLQVGTCGYLSAGNMQWRVEA